MNTNNSEVAIGVTTKTEREPIVNRCAEVVREHKSRAEVVNATMTRAEVETERRGIAEVESGNRVALLTAIERRGRVRTETSNHVTVRTNENTSHDEHRNRNKTHDGIGSADTTHDAAQVERRTSGAIRGEMRKTQEDATTTVVREEVVAPIEVHTTPASVDTEASAKVGAVARDTAPTPHHCAVAIATKSNDAKTN